MDFLVNWLANVPSFAVPFALAALGLIVCEKSGVLNLGAEGYMLVGAMAGAGAMLSLGSHPLLALAIAALAAAALSLLFALLVIALRVNQVISGLVIVFFAQGLTALISTTQGWTNRAFAGLGDVDLGPLSSLPVVGRILFQQDLIVYLTLVIFARWQPWPALAGAVMFGCIEALIPRMAAIGLQLPQYFVLMLPYVVTLGVMVWTSLSAGRRSGQPGALGQPFVREERR